VGDLRGYLVSSLPGTVDCIACTSLSCFVSRKVLKLVSFNVKEQYEGIIDKAF